MLLHVYNSGGDGQRQRDKKKTQIPIHDASSAKIKKKEASCEAYDHLVATRPAKWVSPGFRVQTVLAIPAPSACIACFPQANVA
jgi:hypothetical protein